MVRGVLFYRLSGATEEERGYQDRLRPGDRGVAETLLRQREGQGGMQVQSFERDQGAPGQAWGRSRRSDAELASLVDGFRRGLPEDARRRLDDRAPGLLTPDTMRRVTGRRYVRGPDVAELSPESVVLSAAWDVAMGAAA